MATDFFDSLYIRAQSQRSIVDGLSPPVLVLTEGEDPRVQEAARILAHRSVARVILLSAASELGQIYAGVSTIIPRHSERQMIYQDQLLIRRKTKGLSVEDARVLMEDPLYFGATMVASGQADSAVSGAVRTTAEVIRAGLHCIGPASTGGIISGFFLMILPDGRRLTYADAGVVPRPTPEELAKIAVATADAHAQLTGEVPYVAFLSYSTLGSANGPGVAETRRACELAKQQRPDLCIDGELQVDAALVANVAARKAPQSPVAGRGNVLIFPDLASGNIAYKITERLAGARAIGPILQGFEGSWMDLSRGCSSEDIALVGALSLVLRQGCDVHHK